MTSGLLLDLDSVPLDTQTVPQQVLDIENKTRANPLPWKGQFSPQLIHAFLRTYADDGSRILDPFAGSGTVLLEAARLRLPATGAEVNPAALALSRVYELCNASREQRDAALADVNGAVARVLAPRVGLFSTNQPDADDDLIGLMLNARQALSQEKARDVFDALFVLSDTGSAAFSRERFLAAWDQLRRVTNQLPYSAAPIRAILADARSLPGTECEVDLVVTSPPYINVFNYHQQYRPAVELLGWDILAAAQSEIGSNRKHRSNRFLTIIQYSIDMAEVLKELCRVTSPGTRLIFIVGRESSVRGIPVRNGQLLLSVAVRSLGLRVLARQERKFLNRYGQVIFEDILHLESTKPLAVSPASDIATAFLEELRSKASSRDVREDIEQAILDVPAVRPSRILVPPGTPLNDTNHTRPNR